MTGGTARLYGIRRSEEGFFRFSFDTACQYLNSLCLLHQMLLAILVLPYWVKDTTAPELQVLGLNIRRAHHSASRRCRHMHTSDAEPAVYDSFFTLGRFSFFFLSNSSARSPENSILTWSTVQLPFPAWPYCAYSLLRSTQLFPSRNEI